MKLMNIGFGNMISAQRLLAVVSPDAAPIKRLVQEARERGMLIDASCGRKTKAVLSGLAPETIAHRAGVELEQEPEEE